MAFGKHILGMATAFLALAFSAGSAWAVEAAATTGLNVRSGPGTSFVIVDTLYRGEVVNVVECTAAGTWCRIEHAGPDGWVSRSYLTAPNGAGTPGAPVQFGFTIPLPGGGSITFGTPGYTPPAGGVDPTPPVEEARVCVYDLPNFAGDSICVRPGRSDASISGPWNNRVTSLRVFGGASIRLCRRPNYGGVCNVFLSDRARLGSALNNNASSYDVMPPEPARVCVYDLANFRGDSICVRPGASDNALGATWNDRVTSLRVFGGARIRLCQNNGFGGFCNTFLNDVRQLGGALNDRASSYRVR
jgi:hypothetical protein